VRVVSPVNTGSGSASTHPSLAVVTGTSVDKGGGEEATPPDMSNHSRSSSKKSNHSIHSVHNGKGKCGVIHLAICVVSAVRSP
jgi:hypothetical protein